ncbi:MAG: helix-turn-helix domain-containing protein [Oscillospiraceae bacterium]|jgi:AraC-like DNA-binding protein|nr:helix-turn-helix domain-containing protein [Oscillospiraceae bacterium]
MQTNLYPVQPFFLANTTKYYKIRVPGTPIVHFYSFTAGSRDETHSVAIPDGCVDIMFTEAQGELEGSVCGMVTKGNSVPTKDGGKYFGVRFLPGFLPKKLELSIPELVNSRCSLTELPAGAELLEKMSETPGFEDRARLLWTFIADSWRTNELLQLMISAVCASGGEVRVRELEEKTMYSARYINRVFNDNLGLSPKAFCEHVRFQQLISYMNSNSYGRITDIAADYGYYDQSHFTREFKEFTTVTPGSYSRAVDLPSYHGKFVYLPMAN